MREYSTEDFPLLKNARYRFKKLLVSDKCPFDDFVNSLAKNKDEQKMLKRIYAYMEFFDEDVKLPSTKFRPIKAANLHGMYEFKSSRLRVYVLFIRPDVILLSGGHKGTQEKDIARFVEYAKDFLSLDSFNQ